MWKKMFGSIKFPDYYVHKKCLVALIRYFKNKQVSNFYSFNLFNSILQYALI